jgi:predicted enzyme related to lactoylglutathione lyase
MSASSKPEIGSIGWVDLTVPDADGTRDFYAQVVGWKPSPVDMGGYSDFNMNAPESGEPRAGVCWARGANADLPPFWLIYMTVANVDESAKRCVELGGKVITGPKGFGGQGRYCVIEDPNGAVAALYSATPAPPPEA